MINFTRDYENLRAVHTIKFEHGYIDLVVVNDDEEGVEEGRACFRISHVEVEQSQRGKGFGVALYVEAARLASEMNLAGVAFDDEASVEAQRVWDSLHKHPEVTFRCNADYAGIGGFALKN